MRSQPFPDQLEVSVEVPRFGFIKRDHAGHIDFVSPVPCPFNYGSVPGTLAADGDPEDVVLLGKRLAVGSRVRARVLGRVRFVDAGHEDPKWICGDAPLSARERWHIELFFFAYSHAKRLLNVLRGRSFGTHFAGIELR